jgi:hypothetical protein
MISLPPVPADELSCFRHLFLMEMKGLTFALDSTRKKMKQDKAKANIILKT